MSVIRKSSRDFTINNPTLAIGDGANFSGASAIAIGPNSTATHQTVIQFQDGTLTKTQVEDIMRGIISLDIHEKEERSLTQSVRNLPRAEAVYSDYRSKKKNGPCLQGTREALLGELGTWLVDPTNSRICVLSGLAGIGKSTIAYTFASRADELGILGASFFFSRDESDCKTAKKLFTTIAFQLCVYDKAFAQAIGDVLYKERGSAAITKDLNDQLEALILEPLQDVAKSRVQPIVIVIDALDECDDPDATIVLASLERLVHNFPCFKVLLTTRPQPCLNHRLSSHDVFYLQNIEDKVVNDDIRLYLKSSLSPDNVAKCLPDLISEWSVEDEYIEYLVTAAGKLFIIASTAVRVILDTSAYNPAFQMQSLMADGKLRFNDLESFYVVILRRVLPEKCSIEIMERFKTVIGAILFVQEPLPIPALQHFTTPYTLLDIDAVMKNLQSVITVERNTPQIYHKSFSDFLTGMCHEHFHIRFISDDHHRNLATFCLRILNKQLKRNILDITGLARFMDNAAGLERQGISEAQFREKISLELDYACRYWAIHLESANVANFDTVDEELIQELSIFANEHLIHWIETMSWICELNLALWVLYDVHMLLNSKSTLTELQVLFSDARRFMSKFNPIIEQSALHTYHSALSFTPTETLLYKRYHKETIDNVCQVQGVPEYWDSTIACLNHGEKVDHVIFSQDSSLFASLSGRYAKFWDAVTGAPIGTIVDKVSAIADDFSTAASYHDSTITLYDVNSCTSIATLNVAPTSIVKLTISSDGHRLAAGLSNSTVCLWDWRNGDSVVRLDRFAWDKERGICCLTFNLPGDRLAFGTNGGILLRNGISGEYVAEMKHAESTWSPNCIAFARNNSLLACSGQCQLSLWDGKDGALIGITELKEPNHAMAISSDGTLIAIDQGGRIMLWGPNRRNCIEVRPSQGIPRYDLAISSIAFHHDNVLVAIWKYGSCFNLVSFCDVKKRAFTSSSFMQESQGCIAISPDNMRAIWDSIAAGLQLYGIDFTNTVIERGAQRSSFKASLIGSRLLNWARTFGSSPKVAAETVNALKFSPDCLQLAVCYSDGTIKLWDTSCFTQHVPLKVSSEAVRSCNFDADGSRLASGSNNGIIKLWNSWDGTHIGTFKPKYRRFKSKTHWVTSMVFLRGIIAVQSCTPLSGFESFELDITLWDLSTFRDIVTVTDDAVYLTELFHHDTMLVYYKDNAPSEDVEVTVWDVEKRTVYATIYMGSFVHSMEAMVMSPDKSKLVIQLDDGNLRSFDIFSGCEEIICRREDLDWDWLPPIRPWCGVSVWLHQFPENDHYGVSVRSSQDGATIPLLWIQDDLESKYRIVRGSSMFALVFSGHFVIIRQSSTAQLT